MTVFFPLGLFSEKLAVPILKIVFYLKTRKKCCQNDWIWFCSRLGNCTDLHETRLALVVQQT